MSVTMLTKKLQVLLYVLSLFAMCIILRNFCFSFIGPNFKTSGTNGFMKLVSLPSSCYKLLLSKYLSDGKILLFDGEI